MADSCRPHPFEVRAYKLACNAAQTDPCALNTDIRAWIDTWNDNPEPYIWTKTADQSLDIIARYCSRINDSRHSSAERSSVTPGRVHRPSVTTDSDPSETPTISGWGDERLWDLRVQAERRKEGWLRLLDQHLPILCGHDGPFRSCSPGDKNAKPTHHVDDYPPVTPAPDGWFDWWSDAGADAI